ncbi:hypothetical protein N0V84_003822 [Fusarium piperis]|uniref:Uncharacterized protein n=1 Tax=Fusarium piperis TaxID=1435070 RepID=A0A9W8WGP2_9HYPO|nr:hypothetical protein N0V84_003822 [Fusarium piperis]
MGFQKSAILETKLTDHLPSCFEFNLDTNSIPRWAPGYKDGGTNVHKRLYPVMFFTNLEFPRRHEISFVPASHMMPHDKKNTSIRYRDQVEDFLPRQYHYTPSPSVESQGASSTVSSNRQGAHSSDGSVSDNATPRQWLSPYLGIHYALERASAGFCEHTFVEEEHETDEHGDPRTVAESEEEDDTLMRPIPHMHKTFNTLMEDDENDIYEDNTLRRPSAHGTQRDAVVHNRTNTPAASANSTPNPQFSNFTRF